MTAAGFEGMRMVGRNPKGTSTTEDTEVHRGRKISRLKIEGGGSE
jgi:hypothetical protein